MANPWGAAGKPMAPSKRWVSDYWQRPSAGCSVCHQTFSDVVGRLHEQRTGHQVTVVPDAVRRAA